MVFSIEDVVDRDMCVGCGACSLATQGAVPVTIGRFGVYQASLVGVDSSDVSAADRSCPFSDNAKDEDTLADERFEHMQRADVVGSYMSLYAGRLTDDARLLGSSSGGFTSLVLEELLGAGLVDAVVHVGRNDAIPLFGYQISSSVEELRANRKSAYFATTLTEVVPTILASDSRYAIVGLPCMIKAARLLADENEALNERLHFYVGLICGHLKSHFFAESLGWQAGIEPAELRFIDFRVKNDARDSNFYDYQVKAVNGDTRTRSVRSTLDGSWGFGAFQPEACNFCDDLFAETADIVLGDAWLPEYKSDWRGTSLAVVRNAQIDRLLIGARDRGDVILDELPVDRAVASQASGVRHRRLGMQVRLADDLAAGLPVPKKRLPPGYVVPPNRVALIRQRRQMSQLSLVNFARAREVGDFSVYAKPMRAAIDKYRRIEAKGRGLKGWAEYAARKILRRR